MLQSYAPQKELDNHEDINNWNEVNFGSMTCKSMHFLRKTNEKWKNEDKDLDILTECKITLCNQYVIAVEQKNLI